MVEIIPNWQFILALLIMQALLFATRWYGAECVYRYGLGVMSMPDTTDKLHIDHHHDE